MGEDEGVFALFLAPEGTAGLTWGRSFRLFGSDDPPLHFLAGPGPAGSRPLGRDRRRRADGDVAVGFDASGNECGSAGVPARPRYSGGSIPVSGD